MNRLEANLEILQALKTLVEAHPQLRFGQLIANLNVPIACFYTESSDTLVQIKESDLFERTQNER